jgi:ribose 5-phosphate isomerase B
MAGLVMSAHVTVSASDEQRIREMVRRVVLRTAGSGAPTVASESRRRLVTEDDLAGVSPGGSFTIPAGGLVSPLAQQAATERNISLVRAEADDRRVAPPTRSDTSHRVPPTTLPTKEVVAFGADHGGFEFKEMLKEYVGTLGYAVVDCGTHGGESVDYPDFAFAAAQLVAQGQAWRAILVDGAGIGSCMAANKVPGVRAAMCYDEATAVNSREHNHSNVLTLGAGLIGAQLGRQIVKTWLGTAAGGGRHERRVKKIMDIEQRYLRT